MKNRLKMNLGFFGDEDPTPNTGPEPNPEPAPTPGEPKAEPDKTFTQDEVNRIVAERLDRAKKGMPTADELKAYKEWQENQKTEAEKTAEKLKLLEEKTKEIEEKDRVIKALSKGVTSENLDYALFKAGKLVSDDMDFEKALEKILAEEAHIFNPQEAKKPVTTGLKQSGTPAINDDVNDQVAKLMGVKSTK